MKINPREIAAQAVQEITQDAEPTQVLHRLLRQNGAMPAEDRAFVTELVNGTLRNLIYLDACITEVSKLPLQKMKPWVRAVLRTGAYQLFFMQVPAFAACNESVALVRSRGYSALTGFVNGVLRALSRQEGQVSSLAEGSPEYLSVHYSHPLWLVKLWLHAYDYAFVEELCKKNNTPPEITIRCNSLYADKESVRTSLEREGVVVADGIYDPLALRISKTGEMTRLTAFQQGQFYVQDESSMLAVAALDPQPGDMVLDLCAAPGGKSFLSAQRMQNQGTIHARDISEGKLSRIQEGAERLGISIVETECWDATQLDEGAIEQYDRVLADLPCSGLGLLRKKPDIRLKKSGEVIDSLVKLQKEILHRAAEYVKPGGVLVYSTCTICRKENEKMVEWFLEHHPAFMPTDLAPYLPEQLPKTTAKHGYQQFFPHIHETDGFFIARMEKRT